MPGNHKVMQRIRRLMALGTRNSNQNEAGRALALAQRLMHRHNLTADMLSQAEIKEGVCDSLSSNAQKVPAWLNSLATVVCLASGCRCWFSWYVHTTEHGTQKMRRSLHFYGFNERPEVAVYVFTVLQRQLRIGTSRHMATYNSRRILIRTLRRRADQFREGWVTGVWFVLQSFAPSVEESATLQHWLANRLKENPLCELSVREAGACRGDNIARSAGVAAGKSADIHHGLSRDRTSQQIAAGGKQHD